MWKKAVLLGALGYAIGIVIGVVIFLCNSSRGFAEALPDFDRLMYAVVRRGEENR